MRGTVGGRAVFPNGMPGRCDLFESGRVRGYGVPAPANEAVLNAVHGIERGELMAGLPLLRELTAKLLK